MMPQTAAPDTPAPSPEPSATAPTASSTSSSTAPTARTLWRRGRAILLVVAIIVLAAVVPVLLTPSNDNLGRSLDPQDTSPVGARALAQVLGRHGVTVQRVDSVEEAAAAGGGDTLLMITSSTFLSLDEASRLAALPGDRLLVGDVRYLNTLAGGIVVSNGAGQAPVASRSPECSLGEALSAGSAFTGGSVFAGPSGSVGCYLYGGEPTLIRSTAGGRTVTAVGDGSFMTNLRLADDGNAALALNLAGAKRRLIWLVPPAEPQAGDSGEKPLGQLIPAGLMPAVIELVIAVILVALWRGRRLGPVVAERLPVIVRAAETVEGRGRLYRARRARDRAALSLRAATLDRITPRLGLPRNATPDEIATAASERTGQDLDQVRSVLFGAVPADDAGLVALAGHLDTLERQVQDS
ncbi:hypothetical protein Pth03_17070 [Planotetraspora thailandica]|uniref:DUF4350 domain-containing protein n=1 Tax=Planotetraspora thailandica TaxID=487172 RepID=A0A8J3UY05_9ACTN|nr:DUF4350 domain-containing protein [Planotetraspora thailandica]GII53318.1 hypothetical protein Pth03_17070 [Planotetraspora thailandica]